MLWAHSHITQFTCLYYWSFTLFNYNWRLCSKAKCYIVNTCENIYGIRIEFIIFFAHR